MRQSRQIVSCGDSGQRIERTPPLYMDTGKVVHPHAKNVQIYVNGKLAITISDGGSNSDETYTKIKVDNSVMLEGCNTIIEFEHKLASLCVTLTMVLQQALPDFFSQVLLKSFLLSEAPNETIN